MLKISCAIVIFLWAVAGSLELRAQENPPREITVFAAASLHDVFTRLGEDFRGTYPQARFTFNFAGSQQLLQQLQQGAHADIFASADLRHMDGALASGLIDSASVRLFLRNRLVVVFSPSSRGELRELRDLAQPGVKIVLADKAVPAGLYALQMLDRCVAAPGFSPSFKASVLANVVSYEENVRTVLSKVVLGEADAGVVYTSDAASVAGKGIRTATIPASVNVIATYPIAPLKQSQNGDLAARFVAFLLTDAAQKVFEQFGFIRRDGGDPLR